MKQQLIILIGLFLGSQLMAQNLVSFAELEPGTTSYACVEYEDGFVLAGTNSEGPYAALFNHDLELEKVSIIPTESDGFYVEKILTDEEKGFYFVFLNGEISRMSKDLEDGQIIVNINEGNQGDWLINESDVCGDVIWGYQDRTSNPIGNFGIYDFFFYHNALTGQTDNGLILPFVQEALLSLITASKLQITCTEEGYSTWSIEEEELRINHHIMTYDLDSVRYESWSNDIEFKSMKDNEFGHKIGLSRSFVDGQAQFLLHDIDDKIISKEIYRTLNEIISYDMINADEIVITEKYFNGPVFLPEYQFRTLIYSLKEENVIWEYFSDFNDSSLIQQSFITSNNQLLLIGTNNFLEDNQAYTSFITLMGQFPNKVENEDKLSIKFFPNPSQDLVMLDTKLTIKKVKLVGNSGSVFNVIVKGKMIDISHLPAGSYALIINDKVAIQDKLVIVR